MESGLVLNHFRQLVTRRTEKNVYICESFPCICRMSQQICFSTYYTFFVLHNILWTAVALLHQQW